MCPTMETVGALALLFAPIRCLGRKIFKISGGKEQNKGGKCSERLWLTSSCTEPSFTMEVSIAAGFAQQHPGAPLVSLLSFHFLISLSLDPVLHIHKFPQTWERGQI